MDLIKRVVVAVVFTPGIIAVFWLGGIWLQAFLFIIILISAWELRTLFRQKDIGIPWFIVPLTGMFFLVVTMSAWREVFLIAFAVFALVLGHDIILDRRNNALMRVAASMFSLIYPGVFLASLYHIRLLENGRWLIPLLMLSIWSTDTAAYFIGKNFGKHNGIIKVSPKKTIEGFVAGFVFAFALPFLMAWLKPEWISWSQGVFIGVAVGVFGQIGDLLESMLKRDAGVKDSSQILPGHGGILDRFDSLMGSAPVLLLLLLYFG
ncbi:MAG: phosphatidate cytidylyltransferase [Candidatus Cloacimonetes bacterium]|nr:phosphatidate cytidylyltransferase [Candidatus Cloacimonadota bacterium]